MMRGYYPYGGYGASPPAAAADVPYTTKNGVTGTAHVIATADGRCNNYLGVQAILAALGYDPGPIDGLAGTATQTALLAFAQATGTPYAGGAFPTEPVCAALIQAYLQKQAGVMTPQELPPGPAQFQPVPRQRLPQLLHPPTAAPPPAAPPGGWWSQQSMATKVAVVGGGAIVLGAVAWKIAGGTKSATPNVRRKRGQGRLMRDALAADIADMMMLGVNVTPHDLKQRFGLSQQQAQWVYDERPSHFGHGGRGWAAYRRKVAHILRAVPSATPNVRRKRAPAMRHAAPSFGPPTYRRSLTGKAFASKPRTKREALHAVELALASNWVTGGMTLSGGGVRHPERLHDAMALAFKLGASEAEVHAAMDRAHRRRARGARRIRSTPNTRRRSGAWRVEAIFDGRGKYGAWYLVSDDGRKKRIGPVRGRGKNYYDLAKREADRRNAGASA